MAKISIRCLVSLFFIASILFTGLSVLAAPPDNFTATMVSSGMGMPMAKMGTKSRVENPAMKGLVTINLADAKKIIMLNTVSKTYYEQPTQDHQTTPDVYDPDIVFDKKKQGPTPSTGTRASDMIQLFTGRVSLRKSIKPLSGRLKISRISIFKRK